MRLAGGVLLCQLCNVSIEIRKRMKLSHTMRRLRTLSQCCWLIASLGTPAGAATIVVSTLTDSGTGSLRQAINDALPGDQIRFATNGTITLTNGELVISNNLDIIGSSATDLTISGGGASRVFNVSVGVTSRISGLTIRDGRTPSGTPAENGGGIYNLGSLSLDGCVITANRTGDGSHGTNGANGVPGGFDIYGRPGTSGGSGGLGGGVYSGGTLTLSACLVTGNCSGAGGYGGSGGNGESGVPSGGGDLPGGSGGNGGRSGTGGHGGGICNTGKLSMTACTLTGNSTGFGGSGGSGGSGAVGSPQGGGGGYPAAGGSGGYGGAVYNSGILTMTNCTLNGNSTGNGGWGGDGGWGGYGGACGCAFIRAGGSPGFGGGGAGIWNEQGTVAAMGCTFQVNLCGSGGSFGYPTGSDYRFVGPGGHASSGAGIGNGIINTALVDRSCLTLSMCTFGGNVTGYGFADGHFGYGGHGGAIFNSSTAIVSTCTFSNNATRYPDYGTGGGIFNGRFLNMSNCSCMDNRSANGAGIFSVGTFNLSASTISRNLARYSGGSIYATGLLTMISCTVVSNIGGGIFFYPGDTAFVRNSLITRNQYSLGDLFGYFTSQGHNLVGSSAYGGFTAPGDITGANPLLGPLGDNGGPTLTHALLPGSPALDTGDDTLTGTDQRGAPRRSGAHVDIGAYEFGWPTSQRIIGPQKLSNGTLQFTFTNRSDAIFNVLATTNVSLPSTQWFDLGPAMPLSDGLYRFTDPGASSQKLRFYQLRWP
jgi:hypothetical protein